MQIFIDECGQTGKQVFDDDQPFYCSVAVWLDAQSFAELQPFCRTAELKAATLFSSKKGKAKIENILNTLSSSKTTIIAAVVHKAWMAAGVFVEDCTDFVYNKSFTEDWTVRTDWTQSLSQRIFEALPARTLQQFWETRHGQDFAAFANACERIFHQLKLCGDSQLVAIAERLAATNLAYLWKCSETGRSAKHGYSPNLSAFTSVLHLCEKQSRLLECANVAIFHDEQSQFREQFEQVWEMFKGATIQHTDPSGNSISLPFRQLESLTFVDSREYLGVQIADICASTVVKGLHNENSKFIRSLCRTDFQPFAIGPERWQRKVLSNFTRAAAQ